MSAAGVAAARAAVAGTRGPVPAADRIDAVIFDMDGLLFDSEALQHAAFKAAAAELGIALADDDFLQLVGRPGTDNRVTLAGRMGGFEAVDAFTAVWVGHFERTRDTLELKPGAVELLDRLDELRLPRALCTSSARRDADRNLALHGLGDRFDAVVAAGDYRRGKPAPDPFLHAASVLGIDPARCLALEDSHNGVRAAAAAGMRTVMVPDLLPPTAEIRALCRHVVSSLHEVRLILS